MHQKNTAQNLPKNATKNDNFILENLNNITKLLLFQIEIGNLCRFECVIIFFSFQ